MPALLAWKNGLLDWNPLDPSLDHAKKLPLNSLLDSVAEETLCRFQHAILGAHHLCVAAEHHSDISVSHATRNTICLKKGSMRLRHFACDFPKGTLFFIPSLVNRSTILDLQPHHSMIEYFVSKGYECFLIDWGDPLPEEYHYDIDHYILEHIIPALRYANMHGTKFVTVVGYCMGGILALATACLEPKFLTKLILIATPWDFSALAPHTFQDSTNHLWYEEILKYYFATIPLVPKQMLQYLFFLQNPFGMFNKLSQRSQKEIEDSFFLRIEHWVNDGIDMTCAVAKTALLHWACHNTLMNASWHIKERHIDITSLSHPTLLVSAKNDRITPEISLLPLLTELQSVKHLSIDSGHIGMVAGKKAKRALWQPMKEWLVT